MKDRPAGIAAQSYSRRLKALKVNLSRQDALYLRSQLTTLIRSLKHMMEAWSDGYEITPAGRIWRKKLRQAERMREAVNEAIRSA
jgi:hypothetical protein